MTPNLKIERSYEVAGRIHAETMRRTLGLGRMRTCKEASEEYRQRICKCRHFRGFVMPYGNGMVVLPDLWDINNGAYAWGYIP